ncbi:alpha/beta fold hydrolase [Streptomyces sp. NBC_01351]|uniref:thioesterase II family protein n=1 Tax=Streptomyces sp. NBC_01351 TaxID=2903833 RepID=UPI002E327AAC|nr:alpha/beta fold hydrolase [Streptomyces sp. NBC_01351]
MSRAASGASASELRDRWVRRFHPSTGTGRTLICFPHAGGSAGYWYPLAQTLAPTAEVLVVQYPGRADRLGEEALTSIEELADAAYEALRPWLAGRPVFFGHSMGAIVAFEVARRMERETGRSPDRIVASATGAPSDRVDEGIRFLDDEAVLAAVMDLGGTDLAFADQTELVELLLPAIRGDLEAIENYRAGPEAVVACPITVFTGETDPKVRPAHADAWRRHTLAAWDLQVFAGDHFYFTAEPELFADRLTAVLERSRPTP